MRPDKVQTEAERLKGLYYKSRDELQEAYTEAGSWGGAVRLCLGGEDEPEEEREGDELAARADTRLTLVEEEEPEPPPSECMGYNFWEALVDLLEEAKSARISDAQELQDITGLTEHSLEELEKWLFYGRQSKYNRALLKALEGGAKYPELLKINPSEYGLKPKNEQEIREKGAIFAICLQYFLGESPTFRPSARLVAEATGAPYSLILELMGVMNYHGR